MAFPFGSLIAGVGSALGGLFGMQGAQSGGRAAIRGSKINAKAAMKASRLNLRFQKMFARNSVRWRVRDARKAGIHPLAALGMQGMSFSPSFVSGNPGDGMIEAGRIRAAGADAMGQALGRAATALGDFDDRDNSEYLAALQAKQLESADLQNQLLASQIQMLNQPGTPPRSPVDDGRYTIPGQGAGVNVVPHTIVSPNSAGVDPGYLNDTSRVNPGNNQQVVVPSKDAKERVEDMFVPQTQMAIRHNLALLADPRSGWTGPLGPNDDVSYNPFTGALTKYDKRLRSGVLGGKYGNYHFDSLRAAQEAERRRLHFKRNAY